MVVAVDFERSGGRTPRLQSTEDQLEKGRHSSLDRLRVWPSELPLEFGAPPLLLGRHPAFAAQWALGEPVDEPALSSGRQVEVEGKELGVLEALEAVDGERLGDGMSLEAGVVVEEGLASAAGEVADEG